jgi:uncharacterized protein YciU (UPF0263 family)
MGRDLKRVGEDMIIERIYDIFDEVAKEKEQFERR